MDALASAAMTAAVTTACVAAGRRACRTAGNFEGRDVPVAGSALAFGMAAGLLAVRPADAATRAALAGVAGFALFGFIDDVWGDRSASGFRGHLGALRRGRITTGFLKIAGGGATALVAAWLLQPSAGILLVRAAVIALCANALNLLDTRPVRAAAAFLALGLFAWPGAPAAGCVGLAGALAWLPWDRRRAAMLGDAGSNALGALLGVMAMADLAPWSAAALLAALIAFHAWTEGHSINRAIAASPRLSRLDEWLRGKATGKNP